ncbi:MAG TPA: helix-turn-helix domain-containing protein, partial [Vineibacter sp.]|nr:helix-turn-helix domain-containing protein [Vineibacter sp.]
MTNRQDEIARRIGANVRSGRTRAGLSRKRLAAVANVSERYLNELEKGEANASVGVLVRVADALAVDVTSLMPPARDVIDGHRPPPALHGPLADLLSSMSPAEQAGALAPLQRYLADRRRALKGIALLGLRGAGKSTLGERFAQRNSLPFVSVTRGVEARAGM